MVTVFDIETEAIMVDKTSTQKIKVKTIEKAIETLAAVPEKPKEEVSLREAIEFMKETLVQLLDRGYSYEEIAEMLKESEIQISGATLKQYLGAKKPRTSAQTGVKSDGSKNRKVDGSKSSSSKKLEKLGSSQGKQKDEQTKVIDEASLDEKSNDANESKDSISVNKDEAARLVPKEENKSTMKKSQSSKKAEDEFSSY
ncbi:hypothetical protein H6F67_18475 [Microcoleus sp. FACHB-1515]|uniref:hypothetical protein n=1 Tax=Cyanophyceae TaxID=3028117 RepID=UPI0016859C15|nr:hypothetical protein [Microcoleus sp. FACHB-1515]MBD2091832.1 hypothetical protein [Microcoleus sp. FACHB-1515]